jgi:hypothetical protein
LEEASTFAANSKARAIVAGEDSATFEDVEQKFDELMLLGHYSSHKQMLFGCRDGADYTPSLGSRQRGGLKSGV